MEQENRKSSVRYGFKPDVIRLGEDHVFGSSLSPTPKIILQPDGNWAPYLPAKEIQNLNQVEPYACVAFTILNCVEILIKRQYGEVRNYSDRFLAAVSGTKEGGNQPNVVCEFLRKVGVVPQEMWDFDSSITTFEKFYAPIPPKLYELAQEFNKEWEFKHEFVPNNKELIRQALQTSPLAVSVPAWYERNGKYYRPEGATDNHLTTLIRKDVVFDSYDSIIKELEPMSHSSIKRFYAVRRPPTRSFWDKLKDFWYNIF